MAASLNSPSQFLFKFEDYKKKNECCFPGLTLPSSQNPLEEVGLHKQLSKTLDDLKSSDILGNSQIPKIKDGSEEKLITDEYMTPKSQKLKPIEVKRWASVVKAQKKLQLPVEHHNVQHQSEGTEMTSDIFDCIFKTFPKSFESHKNFFVISDKMFFCNICSLNLDSVLSLSNHLKTRKHEDNAIKYFKTKMPAHLHHVMEFVSFYESDLWCNLCRSKISMSSYNPHETIVNIIAHNNDESHLSKKVNHESCYSANSVLQELAQSSEVIMENMHIIEGKMVPEFRCQLCKVAIMYDENKEVLIKTFTTHMKSVGHLKNQKAVEVLKLYGEASIAGKDNWVVVNGNIMCLYCNCEFETNLQKLISHVNDVEHSRNVLFKLKLSSNFNKGEDNGTVHENIMNEVKSVALNRPKTAESDKKQSSESVITIQSNQRSRLKELLSTMSPGLRDINYVIENDRGSITCLICSCVVPPSTYNLKTHLLGNKHKTNMELKNQVPVKDTNKILSEIPKKTIDIESTVKDTNILKDPVQWSKKTSISKQYGYIFKSDNGSLECMLCQYKVPIQSCNEHLKSDEHKKKEIIWSKNCPSCPSKNPFTFQVLKALPASIRIYKCRQMETIPASVLNHLYSVLIKDNTLIQKNENVIIKNVDGKHSYCSLCKTLIPLSLDVDVLERNLISHLEGKCHEGLFTKKNENTQLSSTSPKVARSLFSIPHEFHMSVKEDPKAFNFEEFKGLISKDAEVKKHEDKNKSFLFSIHESDSNLDSQDPKEEESQHLESEQHKSSSTKETIKDDVFVFGKEEGNISRGGISSVEAPKYSWDNSGLPVADVTRLVKYEEETCEDVLTRRQKQIDYGKNTEGYARYCMLIPRRKRGLHHPVTPPKYLRCSRRTWDGMIRAWRRKLHAWDPPSSTLDLDIRPLD